MKEIPLTRGMVALVDDEDYEAITKWKWFYHKDLKGKTGYARRNHSNQDGKRGIVHMHRVILNTPSGYETDHINGNGLDNRKENLRFATTAQNRYNTGRRRDNTSGYKGVSWDKRSQRWEVQFRINRKKLCRGYFKDKLEAARAYNEAAIKYHGKFAILNHEEGIK